MRVSEMTLAETPRGVRDANQSREENPKTICRKGPIELSAAIVTRGGVQSVLFEVSDSYHVRASFESGGAYTDRECLEMAIASFDRQTIGFDKGAAAGVDTNA